MEWFWDSRNEEEVDGVNGGRIVGDKKIMNSSSFSSLIPTLLTHFHSSQDWIKDGGIGGL